MRSLMPGRRSSKNWEDCEHAIKAIYRLNIKKTDRTEKHFENRIAALMEMQDFPSGRGS